MGLIDKLKQRGETLSTEQKVAFVLLMVFGLGGVVFGVQSFGATIRRPFELQLAKTAGEQYLTLSQKEEKEKEAMKTRDTDTDGLTDYDEAYVYKTSAYLEDTDSDGVDDKTEVFGGKDPNCPEGRDCGGVVSSADEAGDLSVDPQNLSGFSSNAFGNGLTDANIQNEADLAAFFSNMSVPEIRQSLLDSGVPAETLNAMSDDQIRTVFSQAVEEAMTSGQFSALLNQMQNQDASSQTTTP